MFGLPPLRHTPTLPNPAVLRFERGEEMRKARFGTGFAGVGYSGDFGGSWTLTRLVGTAKARELYFLGDIIDAEAAHSL
jgi:hypothetical protein